MSRAKSVALLTKMWHRANVAFTDDEIKALGTLITQHVGDAIERKIEPFHAEMSAQFSEMNERFDFLYSENEKRGQEYLVITEQLNRIGSRLDRIVVKIENHEERLESLENKCA